MKPNLRRAIFAAPPVPPDNPPPPPPPPPGTSIRILNTGYIAQYFNNHQLANYAKARFNDITAESGSLTQDSDGDMATLTAGGVMRQTIWQLTGGLHYIKTGIYKIKWTGADLPITVSWPQKIGEAQKLAPNHWQVNLGQVASTGVQSLTIRWTNDKGATLGSNVPVTDIIVCHSDHENWVSGIGTPHGQGGITNPDYRDWASGCKAFRPMTAYMVNNSQWTTAALCGQESWNGWAPYAPDALSIPYGGLPYTAAAKMAMEMQTDVWANCPNKLTSQTEMNTLAATIWNTPGFQASGRKIITEYSNENWNLGFTHFGFLNGTYGPANGLSAAQSEAQLCLKWARAFLNAGVPRNRLVISISLQAASGWFNGPGGYAYDCLNYIDTGNLVGTGGTKKLWQLVDRVNTAAYISLALTPNGPDDRDFLFNLRLKNRDLKNVSDAQLDTWYNNGIAVTQQWLTAMKTLLDSLGYSGTRGMYEFGQQAVIQPMGLGGTTYEFNIDTNDNTAVWDNTNTGEIPNYDDGDQWFFLGGRPGQGYGTNAVTTIPRGDIGNVGSYVYIRRVSDTKARFFATRANALANTSPLTLDGGTANAPFWADNYTRGYEAMTRIFTYLDSAAGGAMYQRLVAGQTGNFLSDVAFFQDVGEYSYPPSYAAAWGLKRSFYAPDTARFLYAASI